MKVKVIPVFEDNYMYLIIEEHTREAVAVDVAVPQEGEDRQRMPSRDSLPLWLEQTRPDPYSSVI